MRAALFTLCLVACGGGGDANDAPVDASVDAAPICTHLQNLRVLRARAMTFGTVGNKRFEGTICIEGRTDIACVMAALDGKFEICAPADAEFGIRFTKAGFENAVFLHGPGSLQVTEEYGIGDDLFVGPQVWTEIGGPYPTDATHGNIYVNVFKVNADGSLTAVGGATVAILPSNGLTVRYANDSGADTTLNATTNIGLALIGNVPVGDYDLQINAPGLPNCSMLTGGYVSPDNSQHARMRVIGATSTSIALKCAP